MFSWFNSTSATPKPSSIHLLSSILDQAGSSSHKSKKKKKKIPTANVTKHKKPIRYHQWKAIWFMQPVLLYLNPPPVVHRPWDKAQDAKHNPLSQGIKKTNEKTYWFCATTIKTTDVCVCLSLCVWNQWPPLQIPPASSCKKCR